MTSPVEVEVLDLLINGEEPLYATYRWLERQRGERIPLPAFLAAVTSMLEGRHLRLWHVDFRSGDRTELFEVPADLESQYVDLKHSDPSYDPLGLSLTMSEDQTLIDPETSSWSFDVNLEDRTFVLRASPERRESVLRRLGDLLPSLEFSPVTTTDREIAGTISER